MDGPATAADVPHASCWPEPITAGWQCVTTKPGACATPAGLPASGWLPAEVPGTIASAWRVAGRLDIEHAPAFAFDDHWYRLPVTGDGVQRLRLHGLATLAEVWLDDARLLNSDSMFVAHDLTFELHGDALLTLCFRSLTPALEARRSRARWRPRLVTPPTLRNVRTTVLGYMPGWCPQVQPVGPWRPIERLGDAPLAIDRVDIRTRLDGDDGTVTLALTFVHPQPAHARAALLCAGVEAPLQQADDAAPANTSPDASKRTLTGSLRIPKVSRWWPHTHGTPALHALAVEIDGTRIELGKVGFRTLDVTHGDDGEGFALNVNGVPVFCRGACWTSADLVSLGGTREQLAHAFALARDAGMNMLRVGGTMVLESDAFYQLADEYGILIWQDFPFANFDYPNDDAFAATVTREAEQFLARTRHAASLAVLCGGSEIDQQAAMFGLPPALRAQPLFTEKLPAVVARERPDVPYVAHSPTGSAWPFSTRTGVTHYYGVGAYQRPLDDVRRSQVRFAAECLAFANVPDDATLHDALGTIHAHDPRWKRAVPRDPGAGWDFDDVRDHYLRTLYGIEPARLRYEDPPRYLALSRAVVAELFTDVFAEWRRAGSPCGGGIVWQMQDLRAGAGWGVIDATGRPKSAWHALAGVLQPVQAVITDEGLNGLDVHLINETDGTLNAQLEILCLRDGAVSVAQAAQPVELAARSVRRLAAADVLGQFFDFTYAYRFGPRAHDVTIATLRDAASGAVLSEAFHLPERSAVERHDLGLSARPEATPDGWQLVIETRRFARYVHIADAHFRAQRDWFHLAPGRPVTVPLIPLRAVDTNRTPDGEVRAINSTATVYYR
ncbi:glycoside hydrolase family 2 protein [Paraburkholderia sp. Tr-20389]|uniref:glycosyl hydrolase 2 galactose-binding domain-containing protein n=1 Tax=Paraburkholderia sp. Tr-20389 TaxID=2703903 RepID=UPI001F11E159|nr:glycoside hydrolase family 2 protein [Paraburkholderia sp. Tr-20389]